MELGDRVKDKVSGFKGIAIWRSRHITGCDTIGIQPAMDKDGNLPDAKVFDITSVQVVKAGVVKIPRLPESGADAG